MADDVAITPGSGVNIRADDLTSSKVQGVKVVLGADGVDDGWVAASNPLPMLDRGWNTGITHTVTNSANMTTAADISPSPTGGQKIVLADVLISVDTDMSVTLREATSNTVVAGPYYIAAYSVVQITTRSRHLKLPVADRKLQGITSASGNITIETWVYSEA